MRAAKLIWLKAYSGLGKSPRTFQDKELIKWGEDFAYIKLQVAKKYRKHIIEIHIDRLGKKRIAIDKIPVKIGRAHV